ncbi:MAG: GNAT family N-acetyltransferase [Candidatus Spyradocola sp.]|jgi:ribosomal protein S18 acetylase RimI-like enzyme
MQKEEYVIRPLVQDEQEKREVRALLGECANDFVPPLTQRSGTCQTEWQPGGAVPTGVDAYADALLQQYVLLWKQDGKTVGLISFRPDYVCSQLEGAPTVCYLSTLCVAHACRGQGLARKIYEAVIAYARANFPGRPITLRTWSTNGAQLHLMEKLGFTCVRRFPNDRGPGVDTVYYQLD